MSHDLLVVSGSTSQSLYTRADENRPLPWHWANTYTLLGDRAEPVLSVADRLTMPHIQLRPLQTTTAHGIAITDPTQRTILLTVRDDSGPYTGRDEHQYTAHITGVVGPHYQLVSHRQFIRIWADAISAPCETMGLLGRGDTLFINAELPTFDVRGDEIKSYLFGFNTVDGRTAIRCGITPVRTVCRNTLEFGLAAASTQCAIRHDGADASSQLSKWLRDTWASCTQRLHTLREACNLLAATPVASTDVTTVLATTYPTASMPDTTDLDHLAAWEKSNKRQMLHRQRAETQFTDSPTITVASRGNAWGLYNAVSEYENHLRPRRQGASLFVGAGAQRLQTTLNACLALHQS